MSFFIYLKMNMKLFGTSFILIRKAFSIFLMRKPKNDKGIQCNCADQ